MAVVAHACREGRSPHGLARRSSWPTLPSRPSPRPLLAHRPTGSGQNTSGYSRPLDLWMVTICTRCTVRLQAQLRGFASCTAAFAALAFVQPAAAGLRGHGCSVRRLVQAVRPGAAGWSGGVHRRAGPAGVRGHAFGLGHPAGAAGCRCRAAARCRASRPFAAAAAPAQAGVVGRPGPAISSARPAHQHGCGQRGLEQPGSLPCGSSHGGQQRWPGHSASGDW